MRICPFISEPGNVSPCLDSCAIYCDGECAFAAIASAQKEEANKAKCIADNTEYIGDILKHIK